MARRTIRPAQCAKVIYRGLIGRERYIEFPQVIEVL